MGMCLGFETLMVPTAGEQSSVTVSDDARQWLLALLQLAGDTWRMEQTVGMHDSAAVCTLKHAELQMRIKVTLLPS
jgi:hypothetical protein